MSRNNHNEPSMARVVRYSCLLLLAALCALPAHALDTGDIVIVGLKGEVHVTMKGAERTVKAGTVLELPATVQTGRDGGIDLRQGETSVSVGPDTLLEFPALEKAGGPIDRIVQPRGNAFYSIGKRGPRKLRVETPYLVGVVKGTQFNVSAQDTKTTISLFEGLLEIRAADDSSVVDIQSGEIATRSLADTSIGVLKMDAGKTPPPPRAPQGSRNEGGKLPAAPAPRATSATRSGAAVGSPVESRTGASNPVSNSEQILAGPAADDVASFGSNVDVQGEVAVEPAVRSGDAGAVGAPASPDVAGAANVSIDANDVGGDVAPGVSVAAGPPGADVGGAASVDIGGSSGEAGAGVAAVVPAVATETNVNVGLDLGGPAINADVGNSTSVNTGTVGAIDVGNSNAAQVEVHAGANGGPLAGGESAGVAVDVGGDHGPANVDLGVHAELPGAGVNAGASATPGNVDLGVNLGNTNVNVDLGLGDDDDHGNQGPGKGNAYGNGNGNAYGNDNGNGNAYGNGNDDNTGNPGKGNVVDDVVDTVDDALKGLLRKPGKK
ncbi:MAG TPA: FecR domain-containing protein [Steroidobacteraceae bacterium]